MPSFEFRDGFKFRIATETGSAPNKKHMAPSILFPLHISSRYLRSIYGKIQQETLHIGSKTAVGRELDARTHRLGPSKVTTAQTNEKSPYVGPGV